MPTKKVTIGKTEFTLVNADKVRRVLEGEKNGSRVVFKGLGSKPDPMQLIAEYDRRAGLIRGRDGAAVKTGCFWDFENGEPFADPKVVYIFRVNGEVVELGEDEERPMQVQAAVAAEAQKEERAEEAEEEKPRGKKKKAK